MAHSCAMHHPNLNQPLWKNSSGITLYPRPSFLNEPFPEKTFTRNVFNENQNSIQPLHGEKLTNLSKEFPSYSKRKLSKMGKAQNLISSKITLDDSTTFRVENILVNLIDTSSKFTDAKSFEAFKSIVITPDDASFSCSILPELRNIPIRDRMELVKQVCIHGKIKSAFEILSFLLSNDLLFANSSQIDDNAFATSSEEINISIEENEMIKCLLNSFFELFHVSELANFLSRFPKEKAPICFSHLNHLALKYANENNHDISLSILTETKRLGFTIPLPSIITLGKLFQKSHYSSDCILDAMDLLKGGEREGNKAYFLTQLKLCQNIKQKEKLKILLSKNTHLTPNPSIKTLNQILYTLGKVGMVDLAEEWIQKLRAFNLKPNVYSFNGLMLAYCNAGRLEEAERIFERMRMDNLKADTILVGILLNAYAQRGDANAVDRIFDDMKSTVDADAGWYVSKMIALKRKKKTTSAIHVAKELKVSETKPDVRSLNLTMDLYGEMKLISQVKKQFQMMKQSSLSPTTSSYNSLIGAYVEIKNMKRAKEIFQTMQKEDVESDIFTFNTLLKGYANLGDLGTCQKLLSTMEERKIQPNVATCHILVRAMCRKGTVNEALTFFQNFIAKHKNLHSVEIYNVLISASAVQGKVGFASSLYSMLLKNNIEPNINTINSLMNAYSTVGNDAFALETFKAIRSLNLTPDMISYTTLMKAFIQTGKLTKVQEVYDLMLRHGVQPDSRAKDMLRRAKRYLKSNTLPPVALYGYALK